MSLLHSGITYEGFVKGGLLNRGLLYNNGNLSFSASLTETLVPEIGGWLPTFARSTTASVTDFAAVIWQAKLEEARFGGARREENLNPKSEADSGWTAGGTTPPTVSASVTYAGKTAVSTTFTSGVSTYSVSRAKGSSFPIKLNSQYRARFVIAADRPLTGSERIQVFITGRTGSSGVAFSTSNNVTTSWRTFSENVWTNIVADGSDYFAVLPLIDLSSPITIYLSERQVEDVTGQANQNPSEYVSTNVLTSAPYHGANVDGVKYFTTQNGNTVASNVVTEAVGAAIPGTTLKGYFSEGQRTNIALYSNDFSNAVWVKSNITQASGTLTSTAANGTILQTVTSTSQVHTFSIQIKRKTGTGNIAITIDNGATWVTKAISSDWESYEVTQTLANPVFGVRIETSGDEIYIRYVGLETASFSSSPILSTSASVTRNKDNLKYQLELPDNGTIYAEVYSKNSNVGSGIVSKSLGIGPLNYNSDTGISFIDGTNTHVLTYGSPFSTGTRKIAARWSGTAGTMKVFKDGGASSEGAYNGAFVGGSEILIGQNNFFGHISNVKIWNRVLSDSELISMTS